MDVDRAVFEMGIDQRGFQAGARAAQHPAGLLALGPERDADAAEEAMRAHLGEMRGIYQVDVMSDTEKNR